MSHELATDSSDISNMEKRFEMVKTMVLAHQDNVSELVRYHQSLLDDARSLEQQKKQLLDDIRKLSKQKAEIGKGKMQKLDPSFGEPKTDELVEENAAYVAVLIDANKSSFKDTFVKNNLPGGIAAGEALRNAIAGQLDGSSWRGGDVYARVYADMAGLTGHMSDKMISQDEFFRGFTTSFRSFDFTDAGDGMENTVTKIQGALRLFMNDPNCKHVFVTASEDEPIHDMLESNHHSRKPVSIISCGHSDKRLPNLGLKVVEMPDVFQAGPSRLSTVSSTSKITSDYDRNNPTVNETLAPREACLDPDLDARWDTASQSSTALAHHDTSGHYIASDWNSAIGFTDSSNQVNASYEAWSSSPTLDLNSFHDPPQISASASTPYRLDMQKGRRGTISSESASSVVLNFRSSQSTPPSTPKPSGSASSHSSGAAALHARSHVPQHIMSRKLQRFKSSAPPGSELEVLSPNDEQWKHLIPVNKNNQRVDRPLVRPSLMALAALKRLRAAPCRYYHLNQRCDFGSNCEFSHEPLDRGVDEAMLWDIRSQACLLGSACRWDQCLRGHVCTDVGCETSNTHVTCRHSRAAHAVDPRLAKWVPAVRPNNEIKAREDYEAGDLIARSRSRGQAAEDGWGTQSPSKDHSTHEPSWSTSATGYSGDNNWNQGSSGPDVHTLRSTWDQPNTTRPGPASWRADLEGEPHADGHVTDSTSSAKSVPDSQGTTDLMSFTDVSESEAESDSDHEELQTKRSITPAVKLQVRPTKKQSATTIMEWQSSSTPKVTSSQYLRNGQFLVLGARSDKS